MKILYLDLFSGISGDMFIGALVDLGVDARELEAELGKLGLKEYHLHFHRGQKGAIAGVKFEVRLAGGHEARGGREAEPHGHTHGPGHEHPHHHHHDGGHHHGHNHQHSHDHEQSHGHSRSYGDIERLIGASQLSAWVKEKSCAIFERVARAEGRIHGLPPDQVHFHEVGAVDSIVDIVGACIALEQLGRPRLLASEVVDGHGWVDCAHGRFPVPAPATLAILGQRGIPLSQCSEPHELVTPTGAAILAELVEAFGPMQHLAARRIGFGLGTRENQTRPNVLRAILAETAAPNSTHDWQTDAVAVLETNLDDVSPEILGHFVEKALAAGALDVFHTPVQMKKNRPGVLLSVLCAETEADRFTELLLRETSSFGVRRHTAQRRKLAREIVEVLTPYGPVAVKLGRLDGAIVQRAPEYESCRKASEAANVPVKQVYQAALKAHQG